MALTDAIDPYLDPETGVLRNKIGATDKITLDKIEADLVFIRISELQVKSVTHTGDLAELQAIHHFLFQDVYEWAGQVRTVDMRKNVEGSDFFLPCSMIGRASQYAAHELQQDNLLRDFSRDQFIERLAFHYDQFNYIHPFREGNGRVQRIFWDRVAGDAGWSIDWESVRGQVNDEACRIASVHGDLQPLIDMFDRIVSSVDEAADRASAAITEASNKYQMIRPVEYDSRWKHASPPDLKHDASPGVDL